MLSFRREACDPRTGARCAIDDVVAPRFRLRVVATDRVTWDERLSTPADAPWEGDGARVQIVVPLAGMVHVDDGRGPRSFGEGTLAMGDLGLLETRFEPEARVLMIDYAAIPLGTMDAGAGRIAVRTRARLAAALDVADEAERAAAVVALLRAEGLPLEGVTETELAAPSAASDRLLAGALSSLFSNLEAAPMTVDLERRLGLSRRRVVDLVGHFAETYDLDARSFRTLHRRWRVMAGSALMTHPQARTEEVARQVGYGSARAFCHAFAAAGLPSPGGLRRAL